LPIILGDAPQTLRVLARADDLSKPLVVCDDDKLEVGLLPVRGNIKDMLDS
jgi:hypothetical protein